MLKPFRVGGKIGMSDQVGSTDSLGKIGPLVFHRLQYHITVSSLKNAQRRNSVMIGAETFGVVLPMTEGMIRHVYHIEIKQRIRLCDIDILSLAHTITIEQRGADP